MTMLPRFVRCRKCGTPIYCIDAPITSAVAHLECDKCKEKKVNEFYAKGLPDMEEANNEVKQIACEFCKGIAELDPVTGRFLEYNGKVICKNCLSQQVSSYMGKTTAPLLDNVDMTFSENNEAFELRFKSLKGIPNSIKQAIVEKSQGQCFSELLLHIGKDFVIKNSVVKSYTVGGKNTGYFNESLLNIMDSTDTPGFIKLDEKEIFARLNYKWAKPESNLVSTMFYLMDVIRHNSILVGFPSREISSYIATCFSEAYEYEEELRNLENLRNKYSQLQIGDFDSHQKVILEIDKCYDHTLEELADVLITVLNLGPAFSLNPTYNAINGKLYYGNCNRINFSQIIRTYLNDFYTSVRKNDNPPLETGNYDVNHTVSDDKYGALIGIILNIANSAPNGKDINAKPYNETFIRILVNKINKNVDRATRNGKKF